MIFGENGALSEAVQALGRVVRINDGIICIIFINFFVLFLGEQCKALGSLCFA